VVKIVTRRRRGEEWRGEERKGEREYKKGREKGERKDQERNQTFSQPKQIRCGQFKFQTTLRFF